ncbi:hypothetical protein KFE25_002479 [Diacronema lutheri]|uniref:Uncharacterized protein n=2 Tax=Diacronema lutheri TaxID=2081491 RepID=A0A8J5X9I7_DIALT|nr:hypothetical protein KFE25_002479 [Diacronema lutheri]
MGDFATGRVGAALGPADDPSEDDVRQAFVDVESWLAAKAKPMLDRLRPPASAAGLQAVGALHLPDALVWALMLHDGGVRVFDFDIHDTSALASSQAQPGGHRAIGTSAVDDVQLCLERDQSITARSADGSCAAIASSFAVLLQSWRDALVSNRFVFLGEDEGFVEVG